MAVAFALVRSIRATGRAASAPVKVLLACLRLQEVVTVRHALAIMLDLAPLNPEAVTEALLEILTSEWHVSSLPADTMASMYLTRLCAIIASRRVVVGNPSQGVRGGVQVQSLAERRRAQILQEGTDAAFLHALRTAPNSSALLAGSHQRLARLLQGEPSQPLQPPPGASSARAGGGAGGVSVPLQHAACRALERVFRERMQAQASQPPQASRRESSSEDRELVERLKNLFRASPCVSIRAQALCALMWVEEGDVLLPCIRSVIVAASFDNPGNARSRLARDRQQVVFPRAAVSRLFGVLMERCKVHAHLAPTLLEVGLCVAVRVSGLCLGA